MEYDGYECVGMGRERGILWYINEIGLLDNRFDSSYSLVSS
jgi:hypothetical protein